MPPRSRTPKTDKTATPEFYEWDSLVKETRVDRPDFQLRVPVKPPADGKKVDPEAPTHEMLVIPVPSGSSYINLVNCQKRGDVAGILVNLTTSTDTVEEGNDLFLRLMELMDKADFPIVDKLAEQVLMHYFNAPPKAADGSEGGAGE